MTNKKHNTDTLPLPAIKISIATISLLMTQYLNKGKQKFFPEILIII